VIAQQVLLFEAPPRARRALRFVVLGSGSKGNAVVVESGGRRILVDAGFSARELTRRLQGVGLQPRDLDAIVVTHEHGDHVRGVSALARKHHLAVYGTAGTLSRVRWRGSEERYEIRSGTPFAIADLEIEAFDVPHDAREPVGLVIADPSGGRLGVAGDLGCRSRLAWARLRGCHALLLETNHDLEMLRNGPYPWPLKQRVAGRHGHLSNADAVQGLEELVHDDLQLVVGYHLSETNNRPSLVAALVGEELDRLRCSAEVVLSAQSLGTGWLEVR
jgi:phosphoribosyl 1,2-cyclic phosphodiesterase